MRYLLSALIALSLLSACGDAPNPEPQPDSSNSGCLSSPHSCDGRRPYCLDDPEDAMHGRCVACDREDFPCGGDATCVNHRCISH